MASVLPRMNRLLGADGRCLNVAVDHGLFNEASFLQGIENMATAVDTLVKAGPDAIQLSPGEAYLLQDIPMREKPALVLRTDVANIYGQELPRHLFSQLIDEPVEQAVALDAAAVVVNLLLLPDQPELHHMTVHNVTRLRQACTRAGMPLMVEPLVMRHNRDAGGYQVDGDPAKVIPLVRQAAELGADVIKADPTDPVEEYHRVIQAAGRCPVLPRGGGRSTDEEILSRTWALISLGARGVVYGRNIIQHPRPAAMVKALMHIVHHRTRPQEAMKILQEESTAP